MSSNPTNGPRRERLSRYELCMGIARLNAERSTCLRAKVGVTAVRDNRVVAAGYVGSPSGMPHCLDLGCDIENGGCVRSIHAEANLISWAARVGTSLYGCTLWSTHAPCYNCAKLIANLGIERFIYENVYRDDRGVDLLMNLDIPIIPYEMMLNR